MSEVVGSGWTHVTFLRTVGVGSPGLASLVPWSARGSGASRILLFVILLPRSDFSDNNLAYWSLVLRFGSFAPLLEPITSLFLLGIWTRLKGWRIRARATTIRKRGCLGQTKSAEVRQLRARSSSR